MRDVYRVKEKTKSDIRDTIYLRQSQRLRRKASPRGLTESYAIRNEDEYAYKRNCLRH